MKRNLKRKHLSHERTKGSVDHVVPWSEEKRYFYGHRPSLEAGPWSFCGVFARPSCFKRALSRCAAFSKSTVGQIDQSDRCSDNLPNG
jgi:hypothetical protein